MKCSMCHEGMIVKKGLMVKSKVLGEVCLRAISAFYCPHCDETLIPSDESIKADQELRKLEGAAIGQLPIDNFITLNEAAALMEVSKQAFQKNPRVKRGFVYSVKKGRSDLYDKRSVELFKATRDGRYLIRSDVTRVMRQVETQSSPKVNPRHIVGYYYSDTTRSVVGGEIYPKRVTGIFESKNWGRGCR